MDIHLEGFAPATLYDVDKILQDFHTDLSKVLAWIVVRSWKDFSGILPRLSTCDDLVNTYLDYGVFEW